MKAKIFILDLTACLLLIAGCEDKIVFDEGGNFNGRVSGTVHGIITASDTHTPIAGVQVFYAVEGKYMNVESDTNGYYRADHLNESTYTFVFRSPDTTYADWSETVVVAFEHAHENPSERDYEIVIARDIMLFPLNAGVRGYVYAMRDDQLTKPAVGATVRALGFDGILNADYQTITSDDGSYEFSNLPAMREIMLVVSPWTDAELTYGVGTVEVNLVAGASIRADNVMLLPDSPEVVVVSNNFSGVEIPVNRTLELIFDQPVYESGLAVELTREDNLVPVNAALDVEGIGLTIDPQNDLRVGTEYHLNVDGISLKQRAFHFEYVIHTEPAIELLSTNLFAADGIPREDFGATEALVLTFSRAIDQNNPDNAVQLRRADDDVQVLINLQWSQDSKTLNITPVGSYEAGTWYELWFTLHSNLTGDIIDVPANQAFRFRTADGIGGLGRVENLRLEEGFAVDWNTSDLALRWEAVWGAEYYEFYASDDRHVPTFLYLGRIDAQVPFGTEHGSIRLLDSFDWLEVDGIQTPFSDGIRIDLLARAVWGSVRGQFSDALTLRDTTPPTYQLTQDVSADNRASDEERTVVFRFQQDIEYCEPGNVPILQFDEVGGDPNYVLISGVWQWDEDARNGSLTVVVPAFTDASDDRLWLLNVKDNSGNIQPEVVPFTIR